MDYLPPEVLELVFLKLPIKTLGRCTCVCISWKSFIQDPSFIGAQLRIKRRDLVLVRCRLNEGNEIEAYTLYHDDETFTKYVELDFPLYPCRSNYRIIGCCNGVICIASRRFSMKDTYLWNPTIQKFLELPRPHVTYGSHKGFEHEIGFGYDTKKNDFKVIRVVDIDGVKPLEVQIYSLSTGIWRNISHLASDIKCRVYGWGPHAYLNEAAHWVAKIPNLIVVSFHFGQEVFRCFRIPTAISCRYYTALNLRPFVVEGSLSLVGMCNGRCIIWMMKEYGECSSWTKWLEINLYDTIERLIGFRKKSEFIFQIQGKLCSFDHRKVEVEYDEHNFLGVLLNLLEGSKHSKLIITKNISTFDPKASPEDLGIQGKVHISSRRRKKFWCEGYIESLALIGK